MALPYDAQEFNGYPRKTIGTDGSSAERKFLLPDEANEGAFCGLLIGRYASVGGVVDAVRGVPFPGAPWLYVTSIDVEPLGGEDARYLSLGVSRLDALMMSYPNGLIITARYTSEFDDSGGGGLDLPEGTWLEVDGDIGGEMVEITGRKIWLYEGSDPAKDDQAIEDDWRVHQFMPTEDFTLTWNYVARPPWAVMRAMRGKVNNADWFGVTGGFPLFGAEQVLFKGAKYNRQFNFVGGDQELWKISYLFSAQAKYMRDGTPVGWNHVLYSDGSETDWYKATLVKGLSSPPYLSGDFNTLFAYG